MRRGARRSASKLGDELVGLVARRAGGDARNALNILELAAQTARAEGAVAEEHVEDAARKRPLVYDKGGDAHYDFISAFIKSMRGSDPDAAVYYLAAMLEGGEDARFIARRMIVLASEDIGNADPRALLVAVAAAQAVEHVGLPEARLNLAQAAIYLARAPKSNASYVRARRGDRRRARARHTRARRTRCATRSYAARKARPRQGLHLPARRPARVRRRYLPDELQGPDATTGRPGRARKRREQMATEKTARATWDGDLVHGSGHVTTESGSVDTDMAGRASGRR